MSVPPELLPLQDLGVLEEVAEEGDQLAVGWLMAASHRGEIVIDPPVTLGGPPGVDVPAVGLRAAMDAEAGGYFCRDDHRRERVLALDAPHNPVQVVLVEPVVDDAEPPVLVVGVVEAGAGVLAAPRVDLQHLGEPRLPEGLGPGVSGLAVVGEDLDPPFLCGRDHVSQNVPALVERIGSGEVLDRGSVVVLGVGREERPALQVVGLLATMVGVVTAARAPGVAPRPGERGDENGVHAGQVREDVEGFLHSFVDEADAPHLHADKSLLAHPGTPFRRRMTRPADPSSRATVSPAGVPAVWGVISRFGVSRRGLSGRMGSHQNTSRAAPARCPL